jgi:4-amino-4-deoxy-L-arabinose transferase-like glycosyltransferase
MTEKRRTVAVFAGLVVLHWAAGALFLQAFPEKHGTVEHDMLARSLMSGSGFTYRADSVPCLWRPPLYPFFLAAVYATVGAHWASVLTAQVVLSVGASLVLYLMARSRFGRRFSLWAAALAGLYPFQMISGARRMTEVLFTFLLVLTAKALLDQLRDPARWRAVVVGLLGGLTTLCRDSFQFYPLPLLVVFLVGIRPKGRGLLHWGLAIAAWCCVLAPWAVRNYRASGGEIIVTTLGGGIPLWAGNYAPSLGLDDDGGTEEQLATMRQGLATVLRGGGFNTTAEDPELLELAFNNPTAHALLVQDALGRMWTEPVKALELAARKAWRFWFSIMGRATYNKQLQPWVTVIQLAYLLPAALGLWTMRRETRFALVSLSAILYVWLGHIVTTANVRYAVPVMPLVSVFAALGLARLMKLRRGNR